MTDRVHLHGLVPLDELIASLARADVGYVGMLCDLMLSNTLAEYVALGRIGAWLLVYGIPAAPLEGSHLAERLYQALEARQVGDIDILVRDEDIVAARDPAGYGLCAGAARVAGYRGAQLPRRAARAPRGALASSSSCTGSSTTRGL